MKNRTFPLLCCILAIGCQDSTLIQEDSATEDTVVPFSESTESMGSDIPSTSEGNGDLSTASETDTSYDPILDTPWCGDGTVNGGEVCDPGDERARDGCDWFCQVKEGWHCVTEDGGSVCNPICGDELWLDAEACEDGNQINGDGCSAQCAVEDGWHCDGPFGLCVYLDLCGDGVRQWWECCDDGNRYANDGCSDRCQVETDILIQIDGMFPEFCIPMNCGNGRLEPGEECDDGINEGGYGKCTGTCQWDAFCGDGILQAEWEDCDDGSQQNEDGGCPGSCIILSGIE